METLEQFPASLSDARWKGCMKQINVDQVVEAVYRGIVERHPGLAVQEWML